MKKSLCIVLVVMLTLGMFRTVQAATGFETGILSLKVDEETIEYAQKVYKMHVHAIENSFGNLESIEGYTMGNYFTIQNVIQDTYISCFPILKLEQIVGILEVNCVGEALTSSYSSVFSEALEELLEEDNGIVYQLVTDGTNIYAYDGNQYKDFYRSHENISEKAKVDVNVFSNLEKEWTVVTKTRIFDSVSNNVTSKIRSTVGTYAYDGPRSYKYLDVENMTQHTNTCWATVCAVIINFLEGTNLTDEDVARRIYGSNYMQGADMTTILWAYSLYGVDAGLVRSRPSFTEIKTYIKSGIPLHLRLSTGNIPHSVALIGFEDYGSTVTGSSKVVIIMDPASGTRRSILLGSDGGFTYGNYVWSAGETIDFVK